MDITINGSDFARIVTNAAHAAETRSNCQVLTHILLTASAGVLSAAGTDLEVAVTSIAPCDMRASGALVLPAKDLAKAARAWKKQTITITSETTGEDDNATIFGVITHDLGTSRYESMSVDDFPRLAAGDLPLSITIPADRILSAIDQVSYAASSEETRYYLNGIYLTSRYVNDGWRLEMVATDGHRLALHNLGPVDEGAFPMRENGANGQGIIIPRVTVKDITSALNAKMGDVRIDMSESHIRLTCGAVTILSKTVDGCYPDYVRIMPMSCEQMTVCESADFKRAVAAMQQSATTKYNPVKVATNGAIVMSTATATVTVPGESDLDHHEAGFQGSYLVDLAARLDGVVTMRLSKGDPALFVDSRAKTQHVLMPMRV